jgi:hypothetical protein
MIFIVPIIAKIHSKRLRAGRENESLFVERAYDAT